MKTTMTIQVDPDEFRRMIREEVTQAVELLREDPLLSRTEAAKLIGKSTQTIARMEKSGRLVPEYGAGEGHPRYYKSKVLRAKYDQQF